MEYLLPIAAFLIFLAVNRLLSLVGQRRAPSAVPRTSIAATPWARGFLIAGGLIALGIALESASGVIARTLLVAGMVSLAWAGAIVAFNRDGAADLLALRAWAEQGLVVSHPVASARAIGASALLIAAIAIVAIVV